MARGYRNEEIEGSFPIFFESYLEGYRERVNALYPDEHASSSEFTYMKPIHLHVLLRDKNTHVIFVEGNEDKLFFINCVETDKAEFDNISSRSDKLVNKSIKSLTGLDDYLTAFPFYRLDGSGGNSFSEVNRGTLVNRAKQRGVNKADEHYSTYNFTKALEETFIPTTELAVVDSNEILERVKDPAFRYEFGESAKAYNAGLYLAAASTAGIALENILRLIIIKKLGKNRLPDKSYIWLSMQVLDKKTILPGRLRGEVLSQSEIRNSNSHTNEDPVKKETVDTLYRIINELTYYII